MIVTLCSLLTLMAKGNSVTAKVPTKQQSEVAAADGGAVMATEDNTGLMCEERQEYTQLDLQQRPQTIFSETN